MQNLSFLSGSTKVNLLDPEAVAANRMGKVTPAQEAWLKTSMLGRQGCASLAGVGLFLPMLCLFAGIFVFTGQSDSLILLPFLALILIIVFSKLGPVLWRSWQRASKLRADRQNGVIRQAVGELGFGRDGYMVQSGDKQLFIPSFKDSCGLLPGVRYNLFYYEESGVVLSAEQLGGVSAAAMRAGLNRILAEANKYAPEDLDANQRSELSDPQRGRLVKSMLGGVAIGLLFGGFGAVIAFVIISSGDAVPWPVLLIFLAVFGIFLAVGGSMVLNSYLDMNAMPEMEEGQGGKHTERRSSGKSSRTVYFYDIGNKKFQVSYRAYLALIEGLTYRAYYAPRTKTLLSIEVTNMPGIQ